MARLLTVEIGTYENDLVCVNVRSVHIRGSDVAEDERIVILPHLVSTGSEYERVAGLNLYIPVLLIPVE